jgi:hypothetical protein
MEPQVARTRIVRSAATRTKGMRVAKVAPFHSKLQTQVYHDNDKCTVGNNIETYNKVSGTGGYRQCSDCAKL